MLRPVSPYSENSCVRCFRNDFSNVAARRTTLHRLKPLRIPHKRFLATLLRSPIDIVLSAVDRFLLFSRCSQKSTVPNISPQLDDMTCMPSSQNRITIAERVSWLFAFTAGLTVAGFIPGFFGPIVHHPASNQGPLLGIFFTGPLGAILGAFLGFVLPFLTSKRNRLVAVLVIAALLYGVGLWLCVAFTPDPGRPPDTQLSQSS
jgi:hypothetical protein